MTDLTPTQIRYQAVEAAADVIFWHQATTPFDGPVTCGCGQTFNGAGERQHHAAELAIETALATARELTEQAGQRPPTSDVTRSRIPRDHPEEPARHDEQYRTWIELLNHAMHAAQRYDGRTREGRAARSIVRALKAAYGVFDHNTHLGLGPRPVDFPKWRK